MRPIQPPPKKPKPLPALMTCPSNNSYTFPEIIMDSNSESEDDTVPISNHLNSFPAQSNLSSADCVLRLQRAISLLPPLTPIADKFNTLHSFVYPMPMADYDDPKDVIFYHVNTVVARGTRLSKESNAQDTFQSIAEPPGATSEVINTSGATQQ